VLDPPQQNVNREIKTRIEAAMLPEIGFVERLVWFWSNHFCISADVVNNMSGGYEREAIRAHVLGRFGDMLLAAESHPAMLVYLDNFRSIGPMSVAGLINKTGLNENLARETLELHTLGVRSVYTQDDVIRFAKSSGIPARREQIIWVSSEAASASAVLAARTPKSIQPRLKITSVESAAI
jgi:uncharacterized protein (DUF1800 family)